MNFGYFSFFTSKIRTSLWQFRFSDIIIKYSLSHKTDFTAKTLAENLGKFVEVLGLTVYFKVLVGLEAVEEKVDFVYAFIYMPVTAIPRFIVN